MTNATTVDDGHDGYEKQKEYLQYYQLVYSASMVILMQLGFTFLEVGSVRVGFTKSILMKNMVDMILSALMYYILGFGLAFGDGRQTGGFIGLSHFLMIGDDPESESHDLQIHRSTAGWVYHWSYCATAATIVAGAIAERTELLAYCVYSLVGSSIMYPVITHWMWSPTGWASKTNNLTVLAPGVLDDAGGIAVHTCAGMCSLVSCYFVGPRQQRLNRKGVLKKDLPKQNQAFIVFGMMVLWFSWYAFNAGPAVLKAGDRPQMMGAIAVYTTVCAASSGTIYLIISGLVRKKLPEPSDLSNGILAGLVASTSGCAHIDHYFGLIIGSVAGVVVFGVVKVMRKLAIDDVVDAVAVHLGCGTWSALSAPVFAEVTVSGDLTCSIIREGKHCTIGWLQLGVNVLIWFLTIVYVGLLSTVICLILRYFKTLRIRVESERKGVDLVEFNGPAYDFNMSGHVPVDSGSGTSWKKKSSRRARGGGEMEMGRKRGEEGGEVNRAGIDEIAAVNEIVA